MDDLPFSYVYYNTCFIRINLKAWLIFVNIYYSWALKSIQRRMITIHIFQSILVRVHIQVILIPKVNLICHTLYRLRKCIHRHREYELLF